MKTEKGSYAVVCPDDSKAKQENDSTEYSYVNVSFEPENDGDVRLVNSKERNDESKDDSKETQDEIQFSTEMQSKFASLQMRNNDNMVAENVPCQYTTEIQHHISTTSTVDIVLTTEQFVTQLDWSPKNIKPSRSVPEVGTHTAKTETISKGYPLAHGEENGLHIGSMDSVMINGDDTSVSLDSETPKSVDDIKQAANESINRTATGRFSRLCKDEIYRNKVIRTFFVLWVNIVIVSLLIIIITC